MSDAESGDESLMAQLPTVYAVALRLRIGGASDAVIAEALGTDVDAVDGLVEVGHRKLTELRRAGDGG